MDVKKAALVRQTERQRPSLFRAIRSQFTDGLKSAVEQGRERREGEREREFSGSSSCSNEESPFRFVLPRSLDYSV